MSAHTHKHLSRTNARNRHRVTRKILVKGLLRHCVAPQNSLLDFSAVMYYHKLYSSTAKLDCWGQSNRNLNTKVVAPTDLALRRTFIHFDI